MKRYSHLAFTFATTALLSGTAIMAQDTKEQKDTSDKVKQYEELIIRRKTDKDSKVVIEIKDGNVFVDGKPMNDFENDDISVRRSKSIRINVSPFRESLRGGAQNFNQENLRSLGGTRTFLGVVTEEAPGGARINSVSKGSPAEKAGLKEKDIITKIAGEKVQDENDVSRIVRSRKPDEEVKIALLRDGKEVVLNVKLGKTANDQSFGFTIPDNNMRQFKLDELNGMFPRGFEWSPDNNGQFYGGRPRLGIKAQDTEDGKGVKVLDVSEESAAEKAGIKEDDIIYEFNGKAVNSADELAKEAAEAIKEKAKVPVKLRRDGKTMSLEVSFPKKLKTANL